MSVCSRTRAIMVGPGPRARTASPSSASLRARLPATAAADGRQSVPKLQSALVEGQSTGSIELHILPGNHTCTYVYFEGACADGGRGMRPRRSAWYGTRRPAIGVRPHSGPDCVRIDRLRECSTALTARQRRRRSSDRSGANSRDADRRGDRLSRLGGARLPLYGTPPSGRPPSVPSRTGGGTRAGQGYGRAQLSRARDSPLPIYKNPIIHYSISQSDRRRTPAQSGGRRFRPSAMQLSRGVERTETCPSP